MCGVDNNTHTLNAYQSFFFLGVPYYYTDYCLCIYVYFVVCIYKYMIAKNQIKQMDRYGWMEHPKSTKNTGRLGYMRL